MSGPNESSAKQLTIQQRVGQLGSDLDDFEKSIGLPPLGSPNVTALALLDLTKEQLRGMTRDDCSEGAALLAQYSFYLQRVSNREKVIIDYCDSSINAIVRPRLNQQKGWSYDERRLLAIAENDVARHLEGVQVKAQTRLNRLGFLASKVENMSRRLSELADAKRKYNA